MGSISKKYFLNTVLLPFIDDFKIKISKRSTKNLKKQKNLPCATAAQGVMKEQGAKHEEWDTEVRYSVPLFSAGSDAPLGSSPPQTQLWLLSIKLNKLNKFFCH